MKKTTTLSLTIITLGLLNTISVSALTFQNNANVEFTLNPTINITLSSNDLIIDNLAPGSASDSNIITATVSTNAGWGYYLSATANTSGGNTNLTHETGSTDVFTSLSSNVSDLASIPDNHWGYSYSTDGGTNWISGDTGSALAGYNGLPLDNNDSGSTGIKLLNPNSYASSGSVQFKIGAKAANTQAAGDYTGIINFYAVTVPSPTTFDDAFSSAGKTKYLGYYKMQDMTTSVCQAVEQGFNTELIDIRDNEIYTIAKLKDNNCWMLDNLRLGSNQPITLTTDDTNMPANQSFTLPSSISNNFWSYTAPKINADYKNTTVATYNSNIGSAKTGVYYNYCAVSAGTYCYDSHAGVGNAEYDVCPKSWRMPTGGSHSDFLKIQDLYGDNGFRENLAINLAGSFVDHYTIYRNELGYSWTSTIYADEQMYVLKINDSSINAQIFKYRGDGEPIRCLAK